MITEISSALWTKLKWPKTENGLLLFIFLHTVTWYNPLVIGHWTHSKHYLCMRTTWSKVINLKNKYQTEINCPHITISVTYGHCTRHPAKAAKWNANIPSIETRTLWIFVLFLSFFLTLAFSLTLSRHFQYSSLEIFPLVKYNWAHWSYNIHSSMVFGFFFSLWSTHWTLDITV